MARKKITKHDPTKRPEWDRMLFEVLHALRDRTNAAIARESGYLSATTIGNWRKGPKNGGTRYPQHHTLAAAAKVAGFTFELRHRITGEPLDTSDMVEPVASKKGARNAAVGAARRGSGKRRGGSRSHTNGVGRVPLAPTVSAR